MKWSIVGLDNKEGGLGVRKLSYLNRALLGKWCWRFAYENEPFWKHVIVGKYGEEEGGWCSRTSKEGYGVDLWKVIQSGWKGFNNKLGFRVGNGRRVRFWKDSWCGRGPWL